MKKKRAEREWEKARRCFPEEIIIYDEKTGRPTFRYRHPNFPLVLSIIALAAAIYGILVP